MKYPTLANWIRFKKVDCDKYEVHELVSGRVFEMTGYWVWFIKQLDGKTNPYRIDREMPREEVDDALETFRANDVIRDSRFLSKSLLSTMLTVWVPRVTPMMRAISYILNALLLISFIPLLALSIVYFINNIGYISTDYMMTGSIIGILVGVVMHEMGHMIAGLAYGGQVFEVGLLVQFFIPGAYVLLDDRNIKSTMKRVQVYAAGIEMNLLLAAVFVILSVAFEPLSGFFLGAAINNAFIALLNLTFIDSFDGMKIICEILGLEEIVSKANRVIKSKWKREKIKKYGVCGKATVAACYIFKLVQVALPLVFAVNIAGVISWFI